MERVDLLLKSPASSHLSPRSPAGGGNKNNNHSNFEADEIVYHPNASALVKAMTKDDLDAFLKALRFTELDDEFFLSLPLNGDHWTVLHCAAANDAFRIMQWCTEHNADPNIQTLDNQWTPMHFAGYNGAERICTYLRHIKANWELRDSYGDRPCDVARLLGLGKIAEILGDDSAARALREKEEAELQQVMKELRAAEEAKDAERKRVEEARIESETRAKRRKERIERNKKVRGILERERLAVIEKWLNEREKFHSDEVRDFEWLMSSFLFMAFDIEKHFILFPADKPEEDTGFSSQGDLTFTSGEDANGKKKKKRKKSAPPKKKKDAAVEKKPPEEPTKQQETVSKVVVNPSSKKGNEKKKKSNKPEISEEEQRLLTPWLFPPFYVEPDIELPVVNGYMTKEKKKELAKLRKKLEAARVQARVEAEAQHKELVQKGIEEQQVMMAQETKDRYTIEIAFQVGLGAVIQSDETRDRHHTDVIENAYVYHTGEGCVSCTDYYSVLKQKAQLLGKPMPRPLPLCVEDTFSWLCCRQADFDALGCKGVDDQLRPPYHAGKYKFHLPHCTCGSSIERRLSTLGPGVASPLTVSNRKLVFCNPGGFVWSCCGAHQHDSEGCMLHKRYLPGPNRFHEITFSQSLPICEKLVVKCEEEIPNAISTSNTTTATEYHQHTAENIDSTTKEESMIGIGRGGKHALIPSPTAEVNTSTNVAPHTTVNEVLSHRELKPTVNAISKVTVLGNEIMDPTDQYTQPIHCFEVVIQSCEPPVSVTDERFIIGVVLADLSNVKKDGTAGDDDDDGEGGGGRGSGGRAGNAEEDDEESILFSPIRKVEDADDELDDVSQLTPVASMNLASTSSVYTPNRQKQSSFASFSSRRTRSQKQLRKTRSSVSEFFGDGVLNVDSEDEEEYDAYGVSAMQRRVENEFLAGKYGIGWWSHSTLVSGLGVSHNASTTYGPGDIIAVVVDNINHHLAFFKNRSFCFAVENFKTNRRFYPAVTMTAGSAISSDYLYHRTVLPYVDHYMKVKANSERAFRLANLGKTAKAAGFEYTAMFKEIRSKKPKRRVSTVGFTEGQSTKEQPAKLEKEKREEEEDVEDDGRIAFDV